jgi:hypothetical protein
MDGAPVTPEVAQEAWGRLLEKMREVVDKADWRTTP